MIPAFALQARVPHAAALINFLTEHPKKNTLLLWFILVDLILEHILRRAVQEQVKKML
jgi:hypothetical protein